MRDLSSVQDLTVTRGRQAMFSCTVNFQLPKEEITYSWKFAGGEAEMVEPWRPSLGELLARPEALTPGNQCLLVALVALASASVTVLVCIHSDLM
ncbi:hypothetical protein MJT46_012900 [Ovis ammon polii x Ovis aries]|nr:hypothetical protein MJT46_012900 [Ovis ammon polii x Ovis aries]